MTSATKGRVNKFNKCKPVANPIMYAMIRIYLSCPLSSAFSLQSNMSQTTMAVKKVLNEYTSASTALNQWLSVKANVREPTSPAPKVIKESRFDSNFPRQ